MARTKEELGKLKESRDKMLKEFDEIKGRRKNLENIQNKIESLMKGRKMKVWKCVKIFLIIKINCLNKDDNWSDDLRYKKYDFLTKNILKFYEGRIAYIIM